MELRKKNHAGRYGINTSAIIIVFLVLFMYTNAGVSGYISKQFPVICFNIILAVSLNLSCGFLGQLPLGHAGFMAVGAYTSAIISKTMVAASENSSSIFFGMSIDIIFAIALLSGGLFAGLIGILVGLPALRLRGDYLAIITLGFGEIIRTVLNNLPFTGGARGLLSIPRLTKLPWAFGCLVVTIFAIHTLIKSKHGRAIISIRENEIAAASCGINTTYYKTMAFTVSAFFAGIGGGLFAHYLGRIEPAQMGFNKSIEILVMVVLGGMGSIAGSVIAATVLTILPQLLLGFSEYQMVAYSLLLVVVMVLKPSGLLGTYDFSLVDFVKSAAGFFKKLLSKTNSVKGGGSR